MNLPDGYDITFRYYNPQFAKETFYLFLVYLAVMAIAFLFIGWGNVDAETTQGRYELEQRRLDRWQAAAFFGIIFFAVWLIWFV